MKELAVSGGMTISGGGCKGAGYNVGLYVIEA